MQSKLTTWSRATSICCLLGFPMLAGCMTPWFRKSEADAIDTRREAIKERLSSEERPRIISQIGSHRELTLGRLENIGLVTKLPGTGGIVKPSQPRDKMLDFMRRNDVDQPNAILDSNATAMVVAVATVPPAAQKGDLINVGVKLSSHAEAENLQRGWLLETPLVEMSRLGGKVREGFEFATAQGALVTTSQITGETDIDSRTEAILVGGARLLKGRELGISVTSEYADAVTMAAIVPAINNRFTVFDGRKQIGVATPVKDDYIKIAIPPRYQLDPYHYINVVLQIGFNETEGQRTERLETLRKQLLEPTTVRAACWQLEALGESSIPLLAEQLSNPNPEIQFYCAHSLAYLNDKRAIKPLAELTRREAAFRAMCLNALSTIDSYEAEDALKGLLHSADAEARYGAVRALRYRDATNPLIVGQAVGEAGSVLEIPSEGPPCVAVSLVETPEVVIFGNMPYLQLKSFHYVNPQTIIQPNADGTLTISNFEAGREDRIVTVQNDLRSVLQGLSDVGGKYGDWVSFIRECNANGFMIEPIAMNPVPAAGRLYERDTDNRLEPGESLMAETVINSLGKTGKEASQAVWYNPLTWWE